METTRISPWVYESFKRANCIYNAFSRQGYVLLAFLIVRFPGESLFAKSLVEMLDLKCACLTQFNNCRLDTKYIASAKNFWKKQNEKISSIIL